MKTNKKIIEVGIWRIFAYFIIYSFIGFILETTFIIISTGFLESRKSFMLGPFSAIYGVGAVILIISINRFKNNKYVLFIGGMIVGSIVEYLVSYLGEIILHVKWWDYTDRAFNINGRICLYFSIFWGILSVYLISYFNPKVDKLIDKIKTKLPINVLKILILTVIIFLILDALVTAFAQKMFIARTKERFNLQIQGEQDYVEKYLKLYNENKMIKKFVDTFLSDKAVLMVFPKLKVTGTDGEIVYLDVFYPDIQTYYVKFFVPKK